MTLIRQYYFASFALLSVLLIAFFTSCNTSETPSTPGKEHFMPEEETEAKSELIISDTTAFLDSILSVKNQTQVFSWVYGDVNNDSLSDFLVVHTKECLENEALDDNSECYNMTILLQSENQSFRNYLSNASLIHCSNCERTMPHISKTSTGFNIEYYYGSCTKKVVTKFFQLIRDESNWFLSETREMITRCDSIVDGAIYIEELPTEFYSEQDGFLFSDAK